MADNNNNNNNNNNQTPVAAEASQPPQAQEQDINPWSVGGAQDAEGNVAAINYDAIVE